MAKRKQRKFFGEVYRTKPVEIPEKLQTRYWMPKEIFYFVEKAHDGEYDVMCVCPLIPYGAYKILKRAESGNQLFRHKTKEKAVKIAESNRKNLTALLQEFI